MMCTPPLSLFFFFNDTATTEIYTLSLHDALPIWVREPGGVSVARDRRGSGGDSPRDGSPVSRMAARDRKSTRLNSSHLVISYAVFCLKKKNNEETVYADVTVGYRISML